MTIDSQKTRSRNSRGQTAAGNEVRPHQQRNGCRENNGKESGNRLNEINDCERVYAEGNRSEHLRERNVLRTHTESDVVASEVGIVIEAAKDDARQHEGPVQLPVTKVPNAMSSVFDLEVDNRDWLIQAGKMYEGIEAGKREGRKVNVTVREDEVKHCNTEKSCLKGAGTLREVSRNMNKVNVCIIGDNDDVIEYGKGKGTREVSTNKACIDAILDCDESDHVGRAAGGDASGVLARFDDRTTLTSETDDYNVYEVKADVIRPDESDSEDELAELSEVRDIKCVLCQSEVNDSRRQKQVTKFEQDGLLWDNLDVEQDLLWEVKRDETKRYDQIMVPVKVHGTNVQVLVDTGSQISAMSVIL